MSWSESTDASTSAWVPTTESEKEAVRQQVGRILASSLFRNSKRFPSLLNYSLEHVLNGDKDSVKERIIGIEVFGRAPDYDTSKDPVVRMTAVEIRKRLIQYYQAPGHEQEIRIDFPPGSYLPEFHLPSPSPETVPPVSIEQPEVPAGKKSLSISLALLSAILLIAVLALISRQFWDRESTVDLFWSPILKSSAPVLLCIGNPHLNFIPPTGSVQSPPTKAEPPPRAETDGPTVLSFLQGDTVRFTESVALARIAGELGSKGRMFRIRRTESTGLQDLQEGPVVLIGGLDNPWTARLADNLRFTLETEGEQHYIKDRENPASRAWGHRGYISPLSEAKRAYGVISRLRDPNTGQIVVSLAGLLLGTEAAAECSIQTNCLDEAQKLVPRGWKDRNIQIVVAAKIVGATSGTPHPVAVYTW